MPICAGCHKNLLKKEFMTCSSCKSKYDIQCVNMSSEQYDQMSLQLRNSWKCPKCSSKQPKMGNINTPIRSGLTNASCGNNFNNETSFVTTRKIQSKSPLASESGMQNYITEEGFRYILKQELTATIKDLVSAQLNNINEQIAEFCESLSFINKQYEEIKNIIDEKTTIIEQLKKDNDHLKDTVKDLATRLNVVELHMRECNIEINESWLNSNISNSEWIDDRYIVYRKDRVCSTESKKDGGGVMIAVSRDYSSFHITSFDNDNLEAIWVGLEVETHGVTKKLAICVVYFPPPVKLDSLKRLFDSVDLILEEIIVIGSSEKLVAGGEAGRVISGDSFETRRRELNYDETDSSPLSRTLNIIY
ncbi:unnamed protein product [Danaus chrysippus]|uniref:(African queen) hypothetical protein n=1 Tax=Danaus chrysippus TaxID=151541 RepID=A0A8J2QE86_9NEOP|nr:unnamed protein product [Danaus chrysippus]